MTLLSNSLIALINLFQSTPTFALSAAFIWGIFSVILSPCYISSLPLAIGLINGQGAQHPRRALWLSFLFSIGILISIGVIGFITGLLGRMLGDTGRWSTVIVGMVFIAIAGWLLDWIRLPFLTSCKLKFHKADDMVTLFFGMLFGLALGPCSFGFMMPLLAVVFQLVRHQIWLPVGLMMAFALGHIMVIILAGTFTNRVQLFLNWDSRSRGTIFLRKACGILIGLTGIYLIFTVVPFQVWG